MSDSQIEIGLRIVGIETERGLKQFDAFLPATGHQTNKGQIAVKHWTILALSQQSSIAVFGTTQISGRMQLNYCIKFQSAPPYKSILEVNLLAYQQGERGHFRKARLDLLF